MKTILLRLPLGLLLLYFVYGETGPWTALAIFFQMLQWEVYTWQKSAIIAALRALRVSVQRMVNEAQT